MNSLNAWAARHGIGSDALADLYRVLGIHDEPPPAATAGLSEAAVQTQYRVNQSRLGVRLWRNNRGATYDQAGNFIRYGLANDSAAIDKRLKSSDLIGITPHMVQPHDVGRLLGIFTSREIKRPGWRYTGTPREQAQRAWLELVISLGGLASFVDDPNN